MFMMKPRKFSEEFKRDVVEYSRWLDVSFPQVAWERGILANP
ncbi:MAG TPA: hypothetical protein ACQGQH_00755 [Xylella sp.]